MTSTDWISTQQHKVKSAAKLPTAQTEQQTKTSSRLSLYQTPPSSIISIEDFERFAIDRLRGGHHDGMCILVPLASVSCESPSRHQFCSSAVLKGIEEHKAKGCNPKEVQDKARQLADEHLKVKALNL